MIKSTIEKLADPIGFEIGASDDVTQAALLNGFCKGLHDSILQDHGLELQLCYISEKLDWKADKVILSLAKFIKLKNKKE